MSTFDYFRLVGEFLRSASFVCCVSLPVFASDTVDYQRDIQPLFSEHCFKCHGPDEGARQANLRLDRGELVTTKLVSGKSAIISGELDESELVRRISSKDAEMVMPPPSEKNGLNTEQIAISFTSMLATSTGKPSGIWKKDFMMEYRTEKWNLINSEGTTMQLKSCRIDFCTNLNQQ